MFDNLLDGNNVNLLIAFIAGLSTFFASCLLPLVPTYIAYLSGVSLNTPEAEEAENKRTILTTALFFVLGFILTFVAMSLIFVQFRIWLNPIRTVVEKLAGGLFIVLGLFILGIFKNPALGTEHKINTGNFLSKYKNIHALITGSAFGFSWSPCIGPVLAVILFWTARDASFVQGTLALISFGIGLGVPFLIIAAGYEKIMPTLKKYHRAANYINIASGLLIILGGVLILTGQLQFATGWVLRILNINALTF